MKASLPTRPGIPLSFVGHSVQEKRLASEVTRIPGDFAAALNAVMAKLRPIISASIRQEEVAAYIIEKSDLDPPLQWIELVVLACGVVCRAENMPLTYNEVLEKTDRLRGKPLNVKSVYNSIDSLVERRLLLEGDQIKRENGRPSRSFNVTAAGSDILALAATYNHQLVKARSQPAA